MSKFHKNRQSSNDAKSIIPVLLIFIIFYSNSVFSQDFKLTSSRSRTSFGLPSTEYYFDATVSGLPTRIISVNTFTSPNPKGTVVLAAGGTGKTYFSGTYGKEGQNLIDSLYTNGIDVYDIRYLDQEGWSEYCEGLGSYHQAIEIYSELVRYLYGNFFTNKDLVFASGNSGGSFQIAFGLAKFKMDTIFDMVVLTGGPPISNLKAGIFGDRALLERWPNGVIGGRTLTDHLMGWTQEEYCKSRIAPDSIQDILDTVSLVSPISHRSYDYQTFVNFVQSDDPTHAHHQGLLYYDTIRSGKEWYYMPDITVHGVPTDRAGAQKIKELILNYISTTNNSSPISADQFFNIYPNPTSSNIRIQSDIPFQKVELISPSGEVKNKGISKQINLSESRAGIYFIRITDLNGQIYLQKLVKN